MKHDTKASPSSASSSKPVAALATPSDLAPEATQAVADAINTLLADVFALYLKTKNFHWHMSGTHFRDYHLLLDEQSDQIFAMTDPMAERVRKLGRPTLRSIGQIASLQRVEDNDNAYVEPSAMLDELCRDNQALTKHMRDVHDACSDKRDVATTSLLEVWIDETERRSWFLFEAGSSVKGDGGN